jgi:hypothetical protein
MTRKQHPNCPFTILAFLLGVAVVALLIFAHVYVNSL